MVNTTTYAPELIRDKAAGDNAFYKRGIITGLFSGIFYGLYSSFCTLGMNSGIWAKWSAGAAGLSAFALVYLIGALGNGLNDSFSALWALANTIKNGKIKDFGRCVASKPGRLIIIGAILGGPVANTAFIIGMAAAGSIVAPLSALCPAIGAILSRILYNQKLERHTISGILICLAASLIIGIPGALTADPSSHFGLGRACGIVAALGWGIEGCVCGWGTSLVDSEISITIRQCTCGILEMLVIVPVFAIMSGGHGVGRLVVTGALTDPSVIFFIISGGIAFLSFMWWYKGNAMCGTALGMALNGTYSFLSPVFCWLIVGVIGGVAGYSLPFYDWIAAAIMALGIFVIASDPKSWSKKNKEAI